MKRLLVSSDSSKVKVNCLTIYFYLIHWCIVALEELKKIMSSSRSSVVGLVVGIF